MRNIMSEMKRLALLVLLAAGPILAETNEIRCATATHDSGRAVRQCIEWKLGEHVE